ncbi:glycosyltransferase domain-containing protein [Mesorhizobium sp. NBSH29]|uniref:glycosyltransferase domain-containing protein n=1 Tax=Mesorhizobium sp. NBSH29 TaxID=2654249 RepID=UPI0018967A17|nr:glycosyltransferase domain-containing protein [Mesorhizobium sp. NBSH29]
MQRSPGIDFFCFTDDPHLNSTQWKIIQAPPSALDPHRRSKSFKHRPHLAFPDHAESLYLDNTIELKLGVAELFDLYLGSEVRLGAFRHELRDCIYDEADAVLAAAYDTRECVLPQIEHYRRQSYPAHYGLNSMGFILRRHNDHLVSATMDAWHEEVLRFSKRDQISFNYTAWKYKLPITLLPGTIADNPVMTWHHIAQRLPRDFDDDVYLALHEDVRLAGVNPRWHFLHHGLAEGRVYK